jgi:hypothetical protein
MPENPQALDNEDGRVNDLVIRSRSRQTPLTNVFGIDQVAKQRSKKFIAGAFEPSLSD